MNIIFIRSNPVDPDSRVEKEVNSLLKKEHSIKILAWDRNEKYSIKKSTLYLEHGNVEIYRFGIPAIFGGGIKKNFLPLLKFQLRIYQWLKKNKDSFDTIHACDFDTAFISSKFAFKYNKKFVYDIFDYYIDAFNVPRLVKKTIQRKEKTIIENSNAVIICSEKRKEQISGTEPKKLVIIHNTPPALNIKMKNNFELNNEKVKIVYVGILDEGRLIKETVEIVKDNLKYEYHVAGFGKLSPLLEKMAEKHKNIFFYGKIPYKKALELEKSCDIMLALYNPQTPNNFYAAPNKFYEALMLGKPLIMVKNTGMDELVKREDIGAVIDYSKKDLELGIVKLIEKQDKWETISKKMKTIYLESYSWREMEKRLITLYEELI